MLSEDTDKKFQINSSDDEEERQLQIAKSHVFSQHQSRKSRIEDYHELLDLNLITPRTKPEMIEELKKNSINYKELRTLDGTAPYEMQIAKINHTKNYQIVTLTVLIGPFEQNVTILNVFHQSFAEKLRLEPLFYQGHTNIYYFTYKQKELICKSTSYSDNEKHDQMQIQSRKQEIIQGLKEFCISNIMSALKIGPKVQRDFYFDMVVSQSGVEFYLQPCAHHSQKGFTKNDEIVVKTSLKEMHSLGFLHRDIKPGNMMYSKSYEKYVFIDFGISDFKKQGPGELIRSKFLGTYAYCTDQYKKLFKSRQTGMVDAHMNDAWGLSLSIIQIRKTTDPERLSTDTFTNTCNQIISHPDLLERQIKRMIYDNQIEEISRIVCMQQVDQNFQRKILNFFYEVPATQSLRKFYLIDIFDSVKMEKMFQELWECFKTPVFIESYKGNRQFLTLGQQKSNQAFTKIYTKIKDKYSNITKDEQIYKREASRMLLGEPLTQIVKKLNLREHQKLLVNFISFTTLKQQPTFLQKVKACEIYAKRVGFCFEKFEDNDYWLRCLIEEVLQNICLSILNRSNQAQDWDFAIKAIENYFIVINRRTFNMNEFLGNFANQVKVDSQTSNLKKIQIMFNLLIIRRIPLRRFKYALQFIQTMHLEILVQNFIKEIINVERKNCRSDTTIFELLLAMFNIFKNQSNGQNYFEDSEQIIRQVKKLRKHYPEMQRLFNMIEFQVGIKMECNGFVSQGRKLQEENTKQLIVQNGQLCFFYLQIVNLYDSTLEIKKIKTYLALLDQAINCPEISEEYFLRTRIIIEYYLKNEKRVKELIKRYQIMAHNNCNVFFCLNSYKWTLKVDYYSKIMSIKLQAQFIRLQKIIQKLLIKEKDAYFKRQQPIIVRKSQYWFKLQLLQYCGKIQARKKVQDITKTPQMVFCNSRPTLIGLSETSVWDEILLIDRSRFNVIDHLYIMNFDIEALRLEKNYHAIFQYINDRIDLLNQMILTINRNQKKTLVGTLSTIADLLTYSTDNQLLQKFISIIITLLKSPRMGSFYLIEDSKFHLVNGLIKTQNYQFLMKSIILSTKMHSRQLSNSNIPIISRFYSSIATCVLMYYKEKQMVIEIKKIFDTINPKQNPILSIFLLFFIFFCNRFKILRYVSQSLKYLNHTGKQIILSRLYKEAKKLPETPSWKKKYLVKKDMIYPSNFNYTLHDLKHKLNLYGEINNFYGVFLDKFEEKLIRLGRNCQIYDELHSEHQTNKIFDQMQLDSSAREFQKWHRQKW